MGHRPHVAADVKTPPVARERGDGVGRELVEAMG